MSKDIILKKRIWILNHHAETPKTGTGTRHYDFARELLKRGYLVTIFASSHIHYTDNNFLKKGESFKITDEDGIQWVWINTAQYTSNGGRRILGMCQYYWKVLKISRNLEPPDIVIGSAVHLLACLAAYRMSKRYKIPFISEIRDLWPETLIQMGKLTRGSILAKAMNLLEDFIYKKSDRIIGTAPGMSDYIRGRGIAPEKIVYINNGLNTALFDERIAENYPEDEQGRLDRNKFNVVYTGGHGVANDLDTAVKAAKIIQEKGYQDIFFTFFGEGPLKKELMERAKILNLNNVEFKGIVPKYCVPKILKNADVLIVMLKNLPLYQFGMSMNKMFEYMYAGTPIVLAANVSNDYVKETGDGYSIPPEDPQKLAESIIALYEKEKEERYAMGESGVAFVKQNFDVSVLVDKLEAIISKLL